MTRTVEERIASATSDIAYEHRLDSAQIRDVRETLKTHFTEPWLDAPDGPGRWWRKSDTSTSLMKLRGSDFEHWDNLGCKWQPVIGPSE